MLEIFILSLIYSNKKKFIGKPKHNFIIRDERKTIEQKFWKIFKKKISDQNLSFLHKNYLSHIGYNFLNQNTHLLI